MEEKLENGNIRFSYEFTPEEYKAMASEMYSVDEWLTNWIKVSAQRSIDKIADSFSDKKVSRLSQEEKLEIVKNATIKSAKERTDAEGVN